MDRVGISFQSEISPEQVLSDFIKPLRQALERESAGIYSNYLRQIDPDPNEPTEHLIVFQVHDFKDGLRCLRVAAEEIGMPQDISFQNLNPSQPGY